MVVKSKRRGRPNKGKSNLSKSMIISSVKELMRDDQKIPSIRKLAASLDADAMALYHYFPNKHVLLESIAISLVSEIYEPRDIHPWQVEFELLCKSYLQLLATYRGLLQSILSVSTEGPALIFTKRFVDILGPLNLPEDIIKDSLDLIADYLHGFSLSMSCDPDNTLTVDMIHGPLHLVINALGHEKNLNI